MKVTVAQANPVVGDIPGNVARLEKTLAQCPSDADLIVFPELYLVGYPPKDLLERDWFLAQVQEGLEAVRAISARHPRTGILLGAPLPHRADHGKGLYNAAILFVGGQRAATRYKSLLPTYDVFDEERYFDHSPEMQVTPFKGERLGLHICEDAWSDPALWSRRNRYDVNPVAALAAQGATLFINISASPFNVGKERLRHQLISQHARRYGAPFLYVNQVGANDELVFDGRSLCVDAQGRTVLAMRPFEEQVCTFDPHAPGTDDLFMPQEEIASVHDALILGLRDYMRKCGFSRALVGLSGGIDSAVTFALAARALGSDAVLGVSMPSPYSSRGSIEDSRQLAANLGAPFQVIPITGVFESYLEALREPFAGSEPNIAEENIQARIRGNILMALSNKFGYLLLSTGNKSELAVGYCTLYGDMSGGLALISDLPKGMVYALAEYINRQGEVIPRACIEKAPSAELRPNQTDQDTLPPYLLLDRILHDYIEEGRSVREMVAAGLDKATVEWVVRTVDRNEYKRHQAAPGVRVTTKAFGIGRRMPIAARYRH